MEEPQERSPRDVILAALRLAKERVTGELDEKEVARERLADLIVRVGLYGDNETAPERPGTGDLEDALGDPGDRELREAIAAWGGSPAASGQTG